MKLFLEQEPDLRVVFAESDEMALEPSMRSGNQERPVERMEILL